MAFITAAGADHGRLGVMTPYADTVVELRKEEVRDAAGFITQLDNIPIVLPPDDVQDSIS